MATPRLGLLLLLAFPLSGFAQEPVTFGSLVREAHDLARLVRLPDPVYRLVQWSSYDRSSRGAEDPGWYSNADGFGGEPIPNVAQVLEAPGPDGVGRYLLGEARGPGAVVRTWTAGMNGRIQLFVDGESLWEGEARAFLDARATAFLEAAGIAADPSHPAHAFEQEDADHLPIPFAESLRIEWTGALRGLHFYQIQVRDYAAGTAVRSFRMQDLSDAADELRTAASMLVEPALDLGVSARQVLQGELTVEPGREAALERELPAAGGGEAIQRLRVRVVAEDRDAALRGVVMRIAFDGSERPQVEAPVGDFFGTGPGVNPYASLPFTVEPDGWMECRFVMPYAQSCRIAFRNLSPSPARVLCERTVEPFAFDARSLHFRARWRVGRDLRAGGGDAPFDLPFVLLRGQGRFVGCAVQVVNPSGVPTPHGNWWGEGDEKVFVDGEMVPSTFGTGSEDYFDYSWSRPGLFAHPYCGQPLCSGPGTAGFVSNHRYQILDDIPFDTFFAFLMELWTHRPLDGLDYGRTAYLYTRPGALDDHVRIQPGDVSLPVLAERAPVADGGARGAGLIDAWDLDPRVGERPLGTEPDPLATRLKVVAWHAKAGEVLRLRVPFAADGAYDVHLVAAHRPGAAVVEATMGGEAVSADGERQLDLRTEHLNRILSRKLSCPLGPAGERVLELRCVEAGLVGLDYVWIKIRHAVIPGCVEAETMRVVEAADGVEWEVQGMTGDRWSAGRHLWVRTRKAGDFVVLRGEGIAPGRYRATLRPTLSWDYGILAVDIQGERRASGIDTFSKPLRLGPPVDLGLVDVEGAFDLRIELVGSNPAADEPRTFFGIDGVVLERVD